MAGYKKLIVRYKKIGYNIDVLRLWHVKCCIIRYFHIIILSYPFVFKKIYISILLEFIPIVYFYIYIQYPFISIAYFPFIFYILSFVFYNFHYYFIFFLFLLYISTFVFYVWPFVFIDVILLFYLPLFLFYTGACLYSISFPFLFYTVNLFVLYTLFIYFLQAISLAKLSRSSSSLDRLTSDRTNTKTDRL